MSEITRITKTKASIRVFCLGKPAFFIEDWNRSLNNTDKEKIKKTNLKFKSK